MRASVDIVVLGDKWECFPQRAQRHPATGYFAEHKVGLKLFST